MQYRGVGKWGLKLPEISLGLWHNFGGTAPPERSREIVRRAFELGITHFDLANNYGPPYGSAEETFGQILRKDLAGHRDEIVVYRTTHARRRPPNATHDARADVQTYSRPVSRPVRRCRCRSTMSRGRVLRDVAISATPSHICASLIGGAPA